MTRLTLVRRAVLVKIAETNEPPGYYTDFETQKLTPQYTRDILGMNPVDGYDPIYKQAISTEAFLANREDPEKSLRGEIVYLKYGYDPEDIKRMGRKLARQHKAKKDRYARLLYAERDDGSKYLMQADMDSSAKRDYRRMGGR